VDFRKNRVLKLDKALKDIAVKAIENASKIRLSATQQQNAGIAGQARNDIQFTIHLNRSL